MKKICITWASKWIWLAEANLLKNNNELYLCASSLKSFENKWLEDCNLFWYDFSKSEEIKNFSQNIKSKTDKLDVLINNIWIFVNKKFEDFSYEEILDLIDINLKANILITK
jgi:short-subunit dehydrogenase